LTTHLRSAYQYRLKTIVQNSNKDWDCHSRNRVFLAE
jgi:hypothetical protein